MKKPILFWLLFISSFVSTAQVAVEVNLEKFLDSIFIINEIDFKASKADFLLYSKANYKKITSVKDFTLFTEDKIKSKEKSFKKEELKSFRNFYAMGSVAQENSVLLEEKLYELIVQYNLYDSINLTTKAYFTLHELNYWGYNAFKPIKIGCSIKKLYALSHSEVLMEKLGLFIFANKICKANYYVNPRYTCESKCAKIEVKIDMDSKNEFPVDSTDNFVKATFINGDNALKHYVEKNTYYPEKAFGANGPVYISFVITERGEITKVQVVKSPSVMLSKESIRIVQSFPRWKPAQKNGQAVSMKMTLPIHFQP